MHYMPLSEERIISELIRNRLKLNSMKDREEILCLLIDLDR